MNSPSSPYTPGLGAARSGWAQAQQSTGASPSSNYFSSSSFSASSSSFPSSSSSEPVPLTVPTHHPLTYRIPLACSSDKLRKSSLSSEGHVGEQAQQQQTLPSTPAVPSGSSSSSSPQNTEWKIRWACYTLSTTESTAQQALSSTTLTGQTPRATLAVPLTPGHNNAPTPPVQGSLNTISNLKGKGRSRADSDLSITSGGGRSSKRARLHPPSLYSSHSAGGTALPSLSEKDVKLQKLFGTLRSEQDLRDRELFDAAKKAFLSLEDTAQEEVKVEMEVEMPVDETEEGEEGQEKQYEQKKDGRDYLPEKMAYIECKNESSPSSSSADLPANSSGSIVRKLWLFTRRPADMEPGDDSRVDLQHDDSNVFPPFPSDLLSPSSSSTLAGDAVLELSTTGSFTHSDLFPSLYDTNGTCISPSSRPARMNASALQISQSSNNEEATEASEIYLISVKEHLVEETRGKCSLAEQGLGEAMLLGEGVIYPALRRIKFQEDGEDAGHGQSEEDEEILEGRRESIPKGIYLSYDLHLDSTGVVASAVLRSVPLCPVILPSVLPPSSSTPSAPESASRYVRLFPSSSMLTLAPIGLQAIFLRYYGVESPEMNSKKQAQREMEEIEGLRIQWDTITEGLGLNAKKAAEDQEDRWVLCKIAEMEIVWPARSCLVSSYMTSKQETGIDQMTDYQQDRKDKKRVYRRRHYPKPSTRSLLPQKHLFSKLANNTSSYIDRIARERENERRERAEKASSTGNQSNNNASTIMQGNLLGNAKIVGQTPAAATPSTTAGGAGSPDLLFGPSPASVGGATPSAGMGTGMAASPLRVVNTPLAGQAHTPLFSPMEAEPANNVAAAAAGKGSDGISALLPKRKRLGFAGIMPTLNEIAAMLPPVPEEKKESNPQQNMLGTSVGLEATSSSSIIASRSREGQIYPTPQSTSTVSSSTGQTNPHTQTNLKNSNDAFGDFTSWSSYPSDGFGFTNGAAVSGGEMDFGYSGEGNDIGNHSSFFDNDLSMFDSGLTDEDFSFFDTPAILPASTSTASTFPASQEISSAVASVTAVQDDISFITSSEPIDHFGHLMPSGDSPASFNNNNQSSSYLPPGSSTSPLFQNHLTPASSSSVLLPASVGSKHAESLNAVTPAFSASPGTPQEGNNLRAARQSGQFSPFLSTIVELQNSKADAVGESFHSIREIEEAAPGLPGRAHEQPKYAVKLVKGPLLPMRAVQPIQLPAYSPLEFVARPGKSPFPGQLHMLLGPPEDILSLHRQAKAAALRTYIASQKTYKASNMPTQTERKWVKSADTSPESLVFDDSSSSDSSSDSDGSETGFIGLRRNSRHETTYFGQIGQSQTAGVVGPILLQARQALLEITFSSTITAKQDKVADVVEKKATLDKAKVNKSEKEALATVFFQQFMENVDLRERSHPSYHSSTSHLPLCLSSPALPDLPPCMPLQKMQQTFITVFHHMSIMKMSTAALTYWDKLGLQPHSGQKDIRAFVLAASSLVDETVTMAVESWLERMGTVYQASGLGRHECHTSADESGPLYVMDCADQDLSDVTGLHEKLSLIGPQIARESQTAAHAVIYVLVTDDECQRPTTTLIQLCLRLHLLRRGVLPHLVPLSMLTRGLHLLNGARARSFHQSEFSRLAFTIYDRLSVTVHRHVSKRLEQLTAPLSASASSPTPSPNTSSRESRTCPAPAFKIFPSYKPLVNFSTTWPPPTLDILDRHRIFHVAYSVSPDFKWLFLAAIDEKGEHHCLRVRFVEGLDTKLVLKRVWNFAKEITEPVNVEWRISIVKAGSMPVAELQAWSDLIQPLVAALSRPALVSVSSIGTALSTHYDCGDLKAKTETGTASRRPTISLSARSSDVIYSDADPAIQATIFGNPSPIYEDDKSPAGPTPAKRKRLYYALASSSIYFIPKVPVPTTTTAAIPATLLLPTSMFGPANYSLDLLLTASHPQSSFHLPLLRNMHDITQSFVNLQVVAKERWSISDRDGANIGILPWHLAAVTMLSSYDLDSLLPM